MMKQRGISLVELMIAMVIGLIVIGAAIGAFLSSRQTYAMQSELLRIQDDARFAIDTLQLSLRQAGYSGCNGADISESIVTDDTALAPFINGIDYVTGVNNSSTSTSHGLSVVAGNDWIELSYADAEQQCYINSHDVGDGQIYCGQANPFVQGQMLLVTDCQQTTIFQQTNVPNLTDPTASAAKLIEHTDDTSISPGNCVQGLGSPVNCSGTGNIYQFQPGSIVMPMVRTRFLIADNDFDEPSLFQQSLTATSGSLGINNTELVEGVESMQVLFGYQIDGNDNQLAFEAYSHIPANQREHIVALRISLLMRGTKENIAGEQSLTFAGNNLSYTDGRLRRVYSTHIALRNQL